MRIWIAKPHGGRKRHVVVDLFATEESEFLYVVHRFVLPEGTTPWRERSPQGTKVRYRFSLKWLERLILTFPTAERAPAVDAKLAADSRAGLHKLKDPPPFSNRYFRERSKTNGFELYPHQLISIRNALDDAHHMLGLGMGLGKTAVGWAAICAKRPKKTLVITTYGGKSVWADERAEWTKIPARSVQVVDGPADKRRHQIQRIHEDASVLIVNWDLLRLHPELAEIPFDYMVADEFHRARNPEAQVTLAFIQLRAKEELLASGTPFVNRVEELWPSLHRVCRKEGSLKPTETNSKYGSAWLFSKSIAVKYSGGVSTMARNPDFLGGVKKDLDEHSSRFRRDQVSDDLPDIIPVRIAVKLTTEQRKLYNQLRDEFMMELEDGRRHRISDARALITRLKQACWSPELYGGSAKSAKLDEVQGIVRDLVDAGEKAVVFSQWSTATRILQRELAAYNPAYVDGGVKADVRKAEAKRFNTDPDCKLYIGTIKANMESITLGAATNVIFTDKEWSPLVNEQARDRSASGGLRGLGVKHVNVIEILAEDTVDLEIEDLLSRKQAEFDTVVERDGGTRRGRSKPISFAELLAAV